jgi:hypothetical protein
MPDDAILREVGLTIFYRLDAAAEIFSSGCRHARIDRDRRNFRGYTECYGPISSR